MTVLAVRPIDALSGGQLARVQAIYEGAFGQDLRVPFSDLTGRGEADQTFVAMADQAPAGIAALRLLGSVDWSLLRYFAIAGERRGLGFGRRFWQLLHLSLRQAPGPPALSSRWKTPATPAVLGAQLRNLVLAIYTDRYGMAPDDPPTVTKLPAGSTGVALFGLGVSRALESITDALNSRRVFAAQ